MEATNQPPKSDEPLADQSSPAPEPLKPLTDESSTAEEAAKTPDGVKAAPAARPLRRAYRPSHKATFLGLAVIAVILAINAGVIFFVIKGKSKTDTKADQGQVTISQSSLDKLGVNRGGVGQSGVELTINPDTKFKGQIQVGGDVNIAGQLKLNSKFSATDASLAKLQAGDTSLTQLNVNGDGTVSSLNLRKDLTVTGATKLQGVVTVAQLLTVNNNLNVVGSLAVGGTLSARSFEAGNLVSDTTLTIGGHIITRGNAPIVGPGNALGSNGTVSISGNDASGTVAANIGVGAGSGIIANVAFRAPYSNVPHVVISPVGAGMGSVYINRTIGGFSIGVNGSLAPGGYAFDYIVMQ